MVQSLILLLSLVMDEIDFNFVDISIPDFNPEFFVLWINEITKSYEMSIGSLNFIFCSDDYLLDMNKQYLNHDYFTDIITFNYNEENSLSGDVFVSYDRVIDNAVGFGNQNIHDELCRVMAHGVLHLVGFDDKTTEERTVMRENENRCLLLRKSFT